MDIEYSKKLEIDLDLSELSYEEAANMVQCKPELLIVGPNEAVTAGRLANEHHLEVIVLPLLEWGWMLVAEYEAVYSNGA